MPLLIESYEPPRQIAPWFHRFFAVVYALLITRLLIGVYEGPQQRFVFQDNSFLTQLLKRASGILSQPFSNVLFSTWRYPDSNAGLYGTLLVSISAYAFIHFGMTKNLLSNGATSMADRILKACKAMFFVLGSLMLLLIVLRMGVMLYQDFTIGRLILRAPASK
jgi:hypothetical protein